MDRPPVFSLDVLADRSLLGDVLKGVLYTIFFHRLFSSLRPKTRDLLDLSLPAFDDAELDMLITQRTATLLRTLESSPTQTCPLIVRFFEKRPRKAWFTSKAEEKVCWEQWVLNVTLVTPHGDAEKVRTRKKVEFALQKTVMEIVATASARKDHVPPITTNDENPFPYAILVAPKDDAWTTRIGIFYGGES